MAFKAWFGRKEQAASPTYHFDFPAGAPGLEEILKTLHGASARGDEAQMRALLDWLLENVPREADDKVEASKPAYGAMVLGKWLIAQKRFAEAETILKRARGYKKVAPTVFIESRLVLADAIWHQGERDRAEKEALVFVERALGVLQSQQWPISDYRAKLARARFDFAEQAHWEAQAFAEGANDKEGALEARCSDARRQLKTALAYHEAGRETPAREHLEAALNCARASNNPAFELMALNLMSYWLARTPRWEEVEAIPKRAAKCAGEDEALRSKARRIEASIAHRWGRLEEAEHLLASLPIEAEGDNNARAILLAQHMGLALTRGQFDAARVLSDQKIALFPVASREGSRMLAIGHLSRVEVELQAHYCKQNAQLERCHAALLQAQTLLRGDQKLQLHIRALLCAVQVARGLRDEARALAYDLENEFNWWGDAGDTQSNIAEGLARAFLDLNDAPRARVWAEQLVSLVRVPVSSANARELLARACLQSGDATRAHAEWTWVAERPFDCVSVRLAKRALENLV